MQQPNLSEQIVTALALEVRAALLRQSEFFLTQIQTLREELVALKSASVRYRGVWREGERYERGDLVTDRGLLWHAHEVETKSRPGTPDSGFTMMHKGGGSR